MRNQKEEGRRRKLESGIGFLEDEGGAGGEVDEDFVAVGDWAGEEGLVWADAVEACEAGFVGGEDELP